ncbi:MAG: hypothetical protein E6G34_11420 [Actinobacteria bacterium]|nr:MAG: hypothetical protein E6G34_11420 [Actinomycetota bacterium]
MPRTGHLEGGQRVSGGARHDRTDAFLIGSKELLGPVWEAYGIQVEATLEQREVGHAGLVYGITARGKRRALCPANLQPSWIVYDVPILASA